MIKNLDFTVPIKLAGKVSSNERKLAITPSYGLYQPINDSKNLIDQSRLSATSDIRMVESINFDFETQKGKFHGDIYIKEKEWKSKVSDKYKEDLSCTYLSSKNSNIIKDKSIDEIVRNKKLSSIISVLKVIDPLIQDIRMGAKGMVYVDIGAEHLVPINVMGDGMRKILTLLTTIAATKDGILLIDEIENGLHYSFLPKAWDAIFSACKEYNVQLVATTHSYECVESFSKTYNCFEPEEDNIRLFRIDKNGEKHKAFSYTAQVLKAGIEKEFEVR